MVSSVWVASLILWPALAWVWATLMKNNLVMGSKAVASSGSKKPGARYHKCNRFKEGLVV